MWRINPAGSLVALTNLNFKQRRLLVGVIQYQQNPSQDSIVAHPPTTVQWKVLKGKFLSTKRFVFWNWTPTQILLELTPFDSVNMQTNHCIQCVAKVTQNGFAVCGLRSSKILPLRDSSNCCSSSFVLGVKQRH